jgi:hypothetical protein
MSDPSSGVRSRTSTNTYAAMPPIPATAVASNARVAVA